jgi:hypothetical protein
MRRIHKWCVLNVVWLENKLMIGIRRNKKRKRVEGAKKLAQSFEKM